MWWRTDMRESDWDSTEEYLDLDVLIVGKMINRESENKNLTNHVICHGQN